MTLKRSEFRAQYEGGFDCELLDKDKRPVASAVFVFGGGSRGAAWVTLPSDATIRLRCSPFGLHRPEAVAISPQPDKLWVIADGDPNERVRDLNGRAGHASCQTRRTGRCRRRGTRLEGNDRVATCADYDPTRCCDVAASSPATAPQVVSEDGRPQGSAAIAFTSLSSLGGSAGNAAATASADKSGGPC